MIRRVLMLFTLIGLSACGSIEQKSSIGQPLGEARMSGVGDVVLRVTTEKNLPNAFGKADVFGRTTPSGVTTVVYEGMQNGRAIFMRRSVDIDSRATTMNSSPVMISNKSNTTHSGNLGGTPYSGRSTTNGPTYMIPSNIPEPVYFERNKNIIAVDATKLPQGFVVEGVMIKILSAEPLAVRYMLDK